MNEKSALEKLTGNLSLEVGTTLTASLAGGPIAPLLPILTKSLASRRYAQRIESAIKDLEERLSLAEDSLLDLSDAQYKFINEGTLTLLQTTDEEKIGYLLDAISGVIEVDLEMDESIAVARAVRDISVSELKLLIACRDSAVTFLKSSGPNALFLDYMESWIGQGLISLGLLINPASGTVSDGGRYVITPLGSLVLRIFGRDGATD